MGIISIGYLLSFILRLPFSSDIKGLNFLTGIAFLIVWGSMYFFVFEMKKLEDALKADNHLDRLRRQIRTRRQIVVVYILFILGNGVTTLV